MRGGTTKASAPTVPGCAENARVCVRGDDLVSGGDYIQQMDNPRACGDDRKHIPKTRGAVGEPPRARG